MTAVGALGRVSETPYQGVGYLSKTFQSSQVHTPLHIDRITNSEQSYNGYILDKRSWLTKPIWGNSKLLKGTDTRSLPPTKAEINQKFNLSHLDKSHLHFGGGELSYGRSFPTQAKYDVTNLKRSNVRHTDELIPSSNKVHLRPSIINLPFPAEHPQNSHMPKFAVFPGQDSPDDTRHGRLALTRSTTLPSTAPSGCDYVVAEKIKGSPQRREFMRLLSDSERRPLQWHGQSFNQLVKGPDMNKQKFYPTPPTSVKPDFWDRAAGLTVSPKTADAQQNLEVVNADTEYTRQYSASGLNNTGQSASTNAHLTQRNQEEKMPIDPAKSQNAKEEQPYDTTYGKDYSLNTNGNTSTPTSILRNATTKKLNEAKRNKSVKFSDSVTISNGYETSSSMVNDHGKDGNYQPPVQSLNKPLSADTANDERPLTAPSIQRQSFLQTTPFLFPSPHNTPPYANVLQSRPYSTGSFGSLRNDLRHLQENFSKSATRRKFHNEFPENGPDIRRTPDMRITINERRHVIPEIGCHSYYFHG